MKLFLLIAVPGVGARVTLRVVEQTTIDVLQVEYNTDR